MIGHQYIWRWTPNPQGLSWLHLNQSSGYIQFFYPPLITAKHFYIFSSILKQLITDLNHHKYLYEYYIIGLLEQNQLSCRSMTFDLTLEFFFFFFFSMWLRLDFVHYYETGASSKVEIKYNIYQRSCLFEHIALYYNMV